MGENVEMDCQSKNVLNFSKISDKARVPKKATEGAAGMDLCACIDEEITIKPGDIVKIPCGIAISIPSKEYAAFIFARSGLGVKHGITLANSVGVIDSDYRGEIMVGLCNVSNESYTVSSGERIAQLIIMKIESFPLVEVESLDSTERGSGGFGSTGK